MSEKKEIITIDGPAGVGKSTVSRKVAAATGFTYLDTGAMYRGVGFFLAAEKVNLEDIAEIQDKLINLDMELLPAADENSDVGVMVGGCDVSDQIRTVEMGMLASKVSAIPVVRDLLTDLQRSYGDKGKIVAEGRDIGTVVFPTARYKYFLDAAPKERAKRRYEQLAAKGVEANYEEILQMTITRDQNDRERAIAPLKQAEDALFIDTTKIAVTEVVQQILFSVEQKSKKS